MKLAPVTATGGAALATAVVIDAAWIEDSSCSAMRYSVNKNPARRRVVVELFVFIAAGLPSRVVSTSRVVSENKKPPRGRLLQIGIIGVLLSKAGHEIP